MGKLSIDKGRGKAGARCARSFFPSPAGAKARKGDKEMKDKASPALSFWLARKSRENRDMKKAEALIAAALNLAREPSSRSALKAGRTALKEAFGKGFRRVKRNDVLKMLLASAIFFSNEA